MRDLFVPASRTKYCVKMVSIIMALLGCFEGSSQNQKIDSLKLLIVNGSSKQYPDVICELGYEYLAVGNYTEAAKISDMLLSVGRLESDSLQIVRGIAIKASMLRRSGFTDSAIQLYSQTLPIARKNGFDREQMDISNSLGLLFAYAGRHDKALNFLFESLFIREKLGDKFNISVNLQNIAFVYYKLSNFEKAISFNNRAVTLRKAAKNHRDLETLMINMSLCYVELRQFEMATRYIDEAFSICGSKCDEFFLMSAYHCLGNMSVNKKEPDMAEKEFLKSYELSRRINDTRFLLDNLIALSEIYLETNKVSSAEKYLFEAEEIIKNDTRYRLELVGIYAQLARLYRKIQDHVKLSFYQEKYISLNDSLFSEEVTNNLMKAEADYVEREKQARIESQNRILALKEEVIYRQKVANASVGAVAGLVFILALILARNNKQKQLRNKLLDEQVRERTKALEMNHYALQRAWQEHDVFISNSSSEIRSSIAKLQGLCSLASREIDHPLAGEYWKQLDNTSKELSAVLKKMLYSKTIENPMR